MMGHVHEAGRQLTVTVGTGDVGRGKTHRIHGLPFRVKLGWNKAKHRILTKLSIPPEILVHGDAQHVRPVEFQPTGRACELTTIGINDDFFLIESFFLLVISFGLLEIVDEMHDPKRDVQSNWLDGAFSQVGADFPDFVQNLVTRALSVFGCRSSIGKNPLSLLNLIGPRLGILSGKSNERIAEELQRANLIVLDVERFRKRASVDEKALVPFFVGNDTKSVARFFDHAGTFPILAARHLPIRVPHASDNKRELFQHTELPLEAVEDSYGTLPTKHGA